MFSSLRAALVLSVSAALVPVVRGSDLQESEKMDVLGLIQEARNHTRKLENSCQEIQVRTSVGQCRLLLESGSFGVRESRC